MRRLSGCWTGVAGMVGSSFGFATALRHTPVTTAHDAQEVHAVCCSRKLKLLSRRSHHARRERLVPLFTRVAPTPSPIRNLQPAIDDRERLAELLLVHLRLEPPTRSRRRRCFPTPSST